MATQYSCNALRHLISQGGQLVDVRSAFEYRQGALDGAMNIPVESIQQQVKALDPVRPVILYCRSGIRSAAARQFLELMGFNEVYDIGSYKAFARC